MTLENRITFHQSTDDRLMEASQQARVNFRYFWNQVTLDFNRIIPALELACVKAPFSDDLSNPDSPVEHMWVDGLNFDGINITGFLLNQPSFVESFNLEDEVTFPLHRLSDWLCVLQGTVYGGYSIQVIRSQMDEDERAEYDAAWGLDFPSPDIVLTPKHNAEFEAVIANKLQEQIEKEPKTVDAKFDGGRTLLHLECLYGRTPSIEVLLEHGASSAARCDRGWTALDYARSLDWDEAIALL